MVRNLIWALVFVSCKQSLFLYSRIKVFLPGCMSYERYKQKPLQAYTLKLEIRN